MAMCLARLAARFSARCLERFPVRFAARSGAAFVALLALAPAQGLRAAPVAGAGVWTLSRADAPRACRLTLREEAVADKTAPAGAPAKRALGAPATCRKALPILAQADGWDATSDGVALYDKRGVALLDFAPAPAGGLQATGPQGEVYRLAAETYGAAPSVFGATAVGAARPAPAAGFAMQTAQSGFVAQSRPPQKIAGPAPTRASVAGRYAVLRDEGRDTGCMVTLEDKAGRGGKGQSAAILAPACRDHGIVIFDPIGWTLTSGRIALHARKGHSILLAPAGEGLWAREGAEGGKPLSLRRI